jgi:hypothetical protein
VAGPSGPLSATITSQVAPNGATVELFATPGTTALVDWIFVVGP